MHDESNPLGIKSIDHLEFCTDNPNSEQVKLFHTQGFVITHKHTSENKFLYSQGQVRFVLNATNSGQAGDYFKAHGEGVCKISFWVSDCELAYKKAMERGAQSIHEVKDLKEGIKVAAIKGFGDLINEFVERPREIFRPGFIPLASDPDAKPLNTKCTRIDHLTNNVPFGEMEKWVEFYKKIYGFKETRYFDIKGQKTGLLSKVVQLENGAIIIPINQPDTKESKSQIQEFLELHKGAGVQHIALVTSDILDTVKELQGRGMKFLNTPHTYYEDLPKRNFKLDENIEDLEKLSMLADGDEQGYLLQIFTDTYVGPLFFEYIQRKGHDGFGEGNFQALFDAIERDQKERGYI